ncbi:MAG: amidohydrolase [Bacillaceae bacterium]|nr:amidohydrolase [Bacillaceae bacterium]
MEKKLVLNGHICTFDPERPEADAVYIEDGRIRAVGSEEELSLQFGRPDVEKIDLQGGFCYPGLVDSHLHLPAHGMKLKMLDFSGVRSREEMLLKLREKAAHTRPGAWILGLNWNENQFPDRAIPHMDELDEAAPHHPVFLTRTCYHTFLANRAAFQAAGISEDTPDPPGGRLGRDRSGRLNGLVYENASRLFDQARPEPTEQELKDYVRLAIRDAISKGLTAVHTEDLRYIPGIEKMRLIYRELIEEGTRIRTHHLIYHPYMEELDELGLKAGDGDAWLKIGAVKIFSDGAIGGRTALLSQPYADDPDNTGMAIHSQAELNELTLQARKRHMPIAVHAIGDRAADMVMTAMEAHPVDRYMTGGLPDRLIHAQVLRRDLVERMKHLHVVADIQPRFVAGDFPWVQERLGPERLEYAYAWKSLLHAGIRCGGGSDAPIEPIDPLLGIHAAVTRRNPEERHDGYLADQKLSVRQALSLFTQGSASAAGEEQERGTISPGKFADLTVFDRDLLASDPDDLLKAKVTLTMTNGYTGYRR